MALTSTLGTALDATSNPDPNTLATKAPYTAANARINQQCLSTVIVAGWTTQAKPGLFPVGVDDGQGEKKIKVHFVPSGGAAVTYTVTVWFYNPVSNTWVQPNTGAAVSYTGEKVDYIANVGTDAIFLQLSSISAGTISIYYDPANVVHG